MTADETAFAVALAVVFGALGLYLVHLHRLAERLSEEIARAEAAVARKGP